MSKIVINQPYYFAPLHWWERASRGKMVVLDDVQYSTSSGANRALCFDGEERWIVVPIKKAQKKWKISEIELADEAWENDNRNKIESYYRKAEFLDEALELFGDMIGRIDWGNAKMIDVVMESINATGEFLGCSGLPFEQTSNLGIECHERNGRLIEICNKFGCKELVLGRGSETGYVANTQSEYDSAGISIEYQDWKCPVENFSVLDAIARYGKNRVREILGIGSPG